MWVKKKYSPGVKKERNQKNFNKVQNYLFFNFGEKELHPCCEKVIKKFQNKNLKFFFIFVPKPKFWYGHGKIWVK